jgi:ribosomal protein S12 methylthiotransferase
MEAVQETPHVQCKVASFSYGKKSVVDDDTFYRTEITESHDYDVVARIIEVQTIPIDPRDSWL